MSWVALHQNVLELEVSVCFVAVLQIVKLVKVSHSDCGAEQHDHQSFRKRYGVICSGKNFYIQLLPPVSPTQFNSAQFQAN